MQNPKHVLDSYYLEARCQILEIAALLDRCDRACEAGAEATAFEDNRLDLMYESLQLLASREFATDRSERLLNLFSDPQ
ncbi:MAG: hypothetical protein AAF664_17580 [Planctomycetota bacterium]